MKESGNELVNKKSVTYVLKKKVREEKDEDDGKMKSKPAFMTQDEGRSHYRTTSIGTSIVEKLSSLNSQSGLLLYSQDP